MNLDAALFTTVTPPPVETDQAILTILKVVHGLPLFQGGNPAGPKAFWYITHFPEQTGGFDPNNNNEFRYEGIDESTSKSAIYTFGLVFNDQFEFVGWDQSSAFITLSGTDFVIAAPIFASVVAVPMMSSQMTIILALILVLSGTAFLWNRSHSCGGGRAGVGRNSHAFADIVGGH